MVKTLKPFGIAAVGIAAVLSKSQLIQPLHMLLTKLQMKKNKAKFKQIKITKRNLQVFIIKAILAL